VADTPGDAVKPLMDGLAAGIPQFASFKDKAQIQLSCAAAIGAAAIAGRANPMAPLTQHRLVKRNRPGHGLNAPRLSS